MSSAFHIPYAPHTGSCSAIALAVGLHIATALPHFLTYESHPGFWSKSVRRFVPGTRAYAPKKPTCDGKRHPREMGGQEVQQFLSHLAVEGRVAASTQSQALSAIVFLYQQVLKQHIGSLDEVVRARQPHRVPVVLNQDEVKLDLVSHGETCARSFRRPT